MSESEKPAKLNTRQQTALAVAYLSCCEGWTQREIQRHLNLKNQTEVSRLRHYATEQKWLQRKLAPPPGFDEDDVERLAFPTLEELRVRLNRLAEPGQPGLSRLYVVYTGPSGTSDEERLERFGHLAAEKMLGLLKGVKTCAAAWGHTVSAVIGGLEGLPSTSIKEDPEKVFFPVAGEPLNHRDTCLSPSIAASRLARCFGCDQKNALSLLGVATRIPGDMSSDAAKVRRFFAHCRDYERIFGEEPLMEQANMILTGVGDTEPGSQTMDPWFRETIEAENLECEEFKGMALGNLGGVWFPRNPGDRDQVKKLDGINRRWLGVQESHFQKCAKKKGVVVVARGQWKAPIVEHVIGLVSHLFVDERLAEELARRAGIARLGAP